MARGAFWTIIVDDQPTAFRAPVREDLLPTLKQLQRQHPAAVIKWFQRGRLWETPGEAMDASKPPRRGPGWRPGGSHKDPRDQYKVPRDVKRARWAAQASEGRGPWVKGKNAGDQGPGAGFRRKPEGAESGGGFRPREGAPLAPGARKPGQLEGRGLSRFKRPPAGDTGAPGDRPRSDRPHSDRPRQDDRARESRRDDRPRDARESRPPRDDRPGRDRPAPRGKWTPNDERPRGARPSGDRAERKGWTPKPGGGAGQARSGDRPRGARPPSGDRPGWTPKPQGGPGTPRADWRGDRRDRGDARPRSTGQAQAPKPPAAKKARTWRVGEVPPADRKRKKKDD